LESLRKPIQARSAAIFEQIYKQKPVRFDNAITGFFNGVLKETRRATSLQ
jgi:hypothetical protein